MHGRLMTKIAIAGLLVIFAAGTVDARGISRSGTITGPGGRTVTYKGSGSCAGGSCSSQQTWTGPNGRTVTRNNSAQCANGQCNTSHTVTGPNGKGFTRQGTITRN